MEYMRYKMCIFGDGGVGKTTLVNRYISGKFSEDFKMTIGVEFYTKIINIDNKRVSLQIWDFSGQDQFQFKNLLSNYISGASGGIFMYDITRFTSIKNINEWFDIIKKGSDRGIIKIPIIMVGGKLDLEENRSIHWDYAKEVARDHNLIDLIECSSKTGENVENIFSTITNKMLAYSGL